MGQELNSLNGAVKEGKAWRKYWLDQPYSVKERVRAISQAVLRSGVNGTEKIKPLSEYEDRVRNLLTSESILGDDVPALGFDQPPVDTQVTEMEIVMSESFSLADAVILKPTTTPLKPTKPTSVVRRRNQVKGIDEQLLELEREKLELEKSKLELNRESISIKKRKQVEMEQKNVIEREKIGLKRLHVNTIISLVDVCKNIEQILTKIVTSKSHNCVR